MSRKRNHLLNFLSETEVRKHNIPGAFFAEKDVFRLEVAAERLARVDSLNHMELSVKVLNRITQLVQHKASFSL